jgi:hypothetical protein
MTYALLFSFVSSALPENRSSIAYDGVTLSYDGSKTLTISPKVGAESARSTGATKSFWSPATTRTNSLTTGTSLQRWITRRPTPVSRSRLERSTAAPGRSSSRRGWVTIRWEEGRSCTSMMIPRLRERLWTSLRSIVNEFENWLICVQLDMTRIRQANKKPLKDLLNYQFPSSIILNEGKNSLCALCAASSYQCNGRIPFCWALDAEN